MENTPLSAGAVAEDRLYKYLKIRLSWEHDESVWDFYNRLFNTAKDAEIVFDEKIWNSPEYQKDRSTAAANQSRLNAENKKKTVNKYPAGNIVKERLIKYVTEKLEAKNAWDEEAWEFYTYLLKQAENYRIVASGYTPPAYKDDYSKAIENLRKRGNDPTDNSPEEKKND